MNKKLHFMTSDIKKIAAAVGLLTLAGAVAVVTATATSASAKEDESISRFCYVLSNEDAQIFTLPNLLEQVKEMCHVDGNAFTPLNEWTPDAVSNLPIDGTKSRFYLLIGDITSPLFLEPTTNPNLSVLLFLLSKRVYEATNCQSHLQILILNDAGSPKNLRRVNSSNLEYINYSADFSRYMPARLVADILHQEFT